MRVSKLTMIEKVRQIIAASSKLHEVRRHVGPDGLDVPVQLAGLAGSMRSLAIAQLAEDLSRQILVVVADESEAERLRDDCTLVVGEQHVRLFGARRHHAENASSTSVEDVETLRSLIDGDVKLVITHATAVASRMPSATNLKTQVIRLEREKESDYSSLVARLTEFGFEKTQFVSSVGEYSVRGGILDVFPFVGDNPIRIEFFGDTVESIREFDATSQRSIKELATASIVPDLLKTQSNGDSDDAVRPASTLLDLLRSDAVLMLEEPELLRRTLEEQEREGLLLWRALEEMFGMFRRIHLSTFARQAEGCVDLAADPQPSINGSLRILRSQLADLQERGFTLFITCDTEAERERLKDLLSELEPIVEDEERRQHQLEHHLDVSQIEFSLDAFHEGFVFHEAKLALFTEHQIFNRVKRRGKPRKAKFRGITQRELHELRKGDYVVHADYGVGRYDGLKKIRVRDIEQEVVKLMYEEKDTLYVNLNYVNKIQKYSSKEGHVPKLTRLGSGEWDKLKERAKKRVKDIARDLIKLYAQRRRSKGYAFEPDSLWQRELEASFMYEDTIDQAKATDDTKHDMEAPFPMDRLICGDVGFGKTEVAVRAAFKAVMSGKQAALLVPTTILAQQHYGTFLDRLSRYSTRIDVISRFKTKNEQMEILERLNSGATDIVIGTHRLLSKDVHFKDLGLLIVDEEHRFGVAAKEKLRQIRMNVDTLTLTATPIPRTLHFSLMGARDLSIIATPPRNRIPIVTEIAQYSEDHIREVIVREIQRGGQVFFVHDRVLNMGEIIARLQTILPQVRFRHAHGQLRAHELENVMLEFLEKKFDVLVATKIIESGIDIPSVNTIIINRADKFGMAELYQLRGRVGRSNIQAYAYLVTPPISSLPRETVRRLQAIEEFTELGSGFNLAMRDLEIRGAGNLLGGEQSGFIEGMGFEMYTKILEEAVGELKEEEFQDLFVRKDSFGEKVTIRSEAETQTTVEADFDVRIPEPYMENDTERLAVYRRLFSLTTETELDEVSKELTDRFGKHPPEVENLLDLVQIRLEASKLGFRKVAVSSADATIEFPPDTETSFYESERFQHFMNHIANAGRKRMFLKQNGNSLFLTTLFEKQTAPLAAMLDILRSLRAASSAKSEH